MTKQRILMGAGAVVLTVVGIFAVRAKSKFVAAGGIYVTEGALHTCIQVSGTAVAGFSAAGTHQATITTSAGSLTRKLWTNAACNHALYFKP